MKKRVVSWLLVVLMLTSMLPTGVWAEDVYRSSEDTGRYGVSTLASAADAELEGFSTSGRASPPWPTRPSWALSGTATS